MELRLRRIGKVKATQFAKDFDGVYDFWKNKAEKEYNYFDDLKFIKEHGQVFVYLKLPPQEPDIEIDIDDWSDLDQESDTN